MIPYNVSQTHAGHLNDSHQVPDYTAATIFTNARRGKKMPKKKREEKTLIIIIIVYCPKKSLVFQIAPTMIFL